MAPKIGLCSDGFGITEALAIHMLRSTCFFDNSHIELIFEKEGAVCCDATVGFGSADLENNRFSNDTPDIEYTLENLARLEGYSVKLTSAGQVYANFGHQLIQQLGDERGKRRGRNSLSRDFRKLYEYIIEVVDSWYWEIPLQYPMPEKTQLLAFLDVLQNKMDFEWADKRETDFVNFVEQCVAEVGRKFDQICRWYMDSYLPAFDYIADTLKKANEFGFLFFDFNFSKVTLDDLLIRAGNNLRLPRLLIRPTLNKFRIDCVRMVKPILYFPREWVGRSDHVTETLDIEQIDYISSDRTYAIAQTLKAAEQLAFHLLAHAEKNSNIVTSQECWLTSTNEGKKLIHSARSLPGTRENSTSRNLLNVITDNEQSEEEEERSKREKAAMELKALAGIETKNNDKEAKTEEQRDDEQMERKETPCKGMENEGKRPPNCSEDKENNSPVLLLDFDDRSSAPGGSSSEERRTEENARKNAANGEKQKVVPSSSCSFISFSSESPPAVNCNQQMNNNTSAPPPQQNNQNSLTRTLNGTLANLEESEMGLLVERVFNAKRTILEVPTDSFTLSHVLGAAFVSLAIGTANQNLKIRGLTEPRSVGCLIRLGPGIYEYDDGDHQFTSSHMVSMFSLDLSTDILDKRLTIAGLCYAFYAKKAIVRIASNGSPEGLPILLKNGADRRKLTLIFRRVYRRLVLPIDEWVSESLTQPQSLPLSTRESALLKNALSDVIGVANGDKMKLSSEERLVAFRVALHICTQFINDLVRSLLADE
ncbi:hypothetical protein niasHT_038061 [Heterodera trifolii]|uniref:Uncharacterized protein n=1 Tax=Heterodera trifolii TaxID=157864 RepID=A0ABD2HQ19_9BILA